MPRLFNILSNKKQFHNSVFIETGTFKAESLQYASTLNFELLYSCDVNLKYVEEARKIFSKDKRISIFHESSHTLLPKIINPKKSTTFWLDAHWQNNDPNEKTVEATECPLLMELNHIFSFNWVKPPLILIDDASWFMYHNENRLRPRKGYKIEEWPTINDIKKMMPSGYEFKIISDVIWLNAIKI